MIVQVQAERLLTPDDITCLLSVHNSNLLIYAYRPLFYQAGGLYHANGMENLPIRPLECHIKSKGN